VDEMKFDFVCFQETIMQVFSDKCLRLIDPSHSYMWDWIPAKGRARGGSLGLRLIVLILVAECRGILFSSTLYGIKSYSVSGI
jgi:hypothetical protein